MPIIPNGCFVPELDLRVRINSVRFIWAEKYDELPPEQKTPRLAAKAAVELAKADALEACLS